MSEVVTMTLTEFLLARIAEDEDSVSAYYEGRPPVETGLEHADPARVLAECEAKRRIVAIHGDPERECRCQDDYAWMPCPTLRTLALPYADNPAYREEWRIT